MKASYIFRILVVSAAVAGGVFACGSLLEPDRYHYEGEISLSATEALCLHTEVSGSEIHILYGDADENALVVYDFYGDSPKFADTWGLEYERTPQSSVDRFGAILVGILVAMVLLLVGALLIRSLEGVGEEDGRKKGVKV